MPRRRAKGRGSERFGTTAGFRWISLLVSFWSRTACRSLLYRRGICHAVANHIDVAGPTDPLIGPDLDLIGIRNAAQCQRQRAGLACLRQQRHLLRLQFERRGLPNDRVLAFFFLWRL